ncbi:S8 family peptidase [Schaalia sp. JY-X169]|uniref:S8 family peptidase n=1 Tax=Schaalia sp. JY-X169 TaxID=2758572 RepID=UPI0015F4614D|nr:S8 family peptidase [Schaalia sp. JY-X169]
MAERDRPHIVVPMPPTPEPFTIPSTGGGGDKPGYTGSRFRHGKRLAQELEAALAPPIDDGEHEGAYVTFVSSPELELAIESLDVQKSGDQPELVAVREIHTPSGTIVEATVFIPDGKKGYFQRKLDAYVQSASDDKAKNAKFVDGIQNIKRATIRQLWTDPDEMFPVDPATTHWWEVWLRKRDGNERERMTRFSEALGLRTSSHYLGFGDRTVVLLQASADQLAQVFESIDDIAELRRPHEIASFLPELYASEQREWVDDLRCRVETASLDAPVVCILDRGVQASHPLLSHSLDVGDLHAADSSWSHDPVIWHHGTELAGLALYGDVHTAIIDTHAVRLGHRLESVKILPDRGSNDPDLYGAVTARAIDQPEITARDRSRVFMLAVTATTERPDGSTSRIGTESGKPTSWSASIDALAYGRAINDATPKFMYLDRDEPRTPRLFVVSTGNIRDVRAEDDHLDRSDAEAIEDPAQAWNALTVGAYSEHDDMVGSPAEFNGYVPIARRGELSPSSRTSVSFESTRWPFKPEVVASGGNYARTPSGDETDTPPNLAVLTTRFQQFGQGFFTTTRDTSAATAQVAALAADIYAAYPQLRPETVRALVVHSAQWTDAMEERFDPKASKSHLVNMLRRYGMGVPNLERALYSATDALTLISEASLHPYERVGTSNDGKTREMNLHELPWPVEQLRDLGGEIVDLRVTLSYFIEPNPSSRGWTGRYIYPSHGLRFAMKRPEDNFDAFRQRNNTRARRDGEKPLKLDTEKGWLFGSDQQKAPGSLHTDIWRGTAEDLASKGGMLVYPVGGWWKNRHLMDQSDQGVDYSLVVSIESPNIDVDLWTPVYQKVRAVTEIIV